MKKTLPLLIVVGLISSCWSNNNSDTKISNEKTTYEEIRINYSLQNRTLRMLLITDLPDDIKVTVSVSRSYWEKGNSSEYAVDYISEQSTIGDWKKEHEILIDDKNWKSDLARKQQELSTAGLGFDVDRVSDSIEIYAVVPYSNKPYPNFKGKGIGKDEITIHFPIDGTVVMKSKYAYYQSLQKGVTYSISETIPLMPEFEPSDPLAAINEMKELVSGSRITILSIKKKNNTPWYEVNSTDPKGNNTGKGWVNSIALIGQEILVIN